MNKNRKLINALLVSAMMLGNVAPVALAANGDSSVKRLEGNTRVETSVKVSNEAYDTADTVVLAGYNGEVDALTGTILASMHDAPLLLVSDKASDLATVKAEIAKLGAKKVVLLGDTKVISKSISDDLKASGLNVSRVAGDDRFDTAAEVAATVGAKHEHVFLTNDGRSGELADALATGPVSGRDQDPILLTSQAGLPTQTIKALKDMGVKRVTIVGGNLAVSDVVKTELEGLGIKATRVAGDNRWETAEAIANTYFSKSTKAIVANDGRFSYADALVGGYLGAKHEAPILLTLPNQLNEATENYLGSNASFAYILGGEKVVSGFTLAEIEKIISEKVNAELAVESVNAVNATQVEVKFNKSIDAATLFADGKSGAFKDLGSSNKVVELSTLDGISAGNLEGKLLDEGKTLLITSANVLSKRYDLKMEALKSKDGKKLAKYDEMITISADTTAPTIVGVEKVSATTVKVKFSEPVQAYGNITYKYANGENVTGISGTVASGAEEVTLTMDNTVLVGQDITATFIGVQDQAGNIITPNPSTVTFQKGNKDGVKPVVTTINQTAAKEFSVKFSEELSVKPVIKINNTVVNPADIVKDSNDVTKYIVKTPSVLNGATTIEVSNYTDLSGEEGAIDTQIVIFVKDAVAPKVLSSAVVKDATTGKEFLELTMDKNIDLSQSSKIDASRTSGSHVKDFITTSISNGELVDTPLTHKDATNRNIIRFELDTLLGAKDVEAAKYSLDLGLSGVVSDAGVSIMNEVVTFTRGKDSSAPVTTKIGLIASSPIVKDSTDNDKVIVKFNQIVDGATGTDASNYQVNGAIVESASILSSDKQQVVLKLQKNSNTFTGLRNVTVKNVKMAGSTVAMDTVTEKVNLDENVRPTVQSAKYTKTNASGNVTEITLKFSENVKSVGSDLDLFKIYVGNSTVATPVTNVDLSTNSSDEIVLTVPSELTPAQINQGITVKLNGTNRIIDLKTNPLEFTSIKTTF